MGGAWGGGGGGGGDIWIDDRSKLAIIKMLCYAKASDSFMHPASGISWGHMMVIMWMAPLGWSCAYLSVKSSEHVGRICIGILALLLHQIRLVLPGMSVKSSSQEALCQRGLHPC
jgi:hypothetical protein